MVGVGRNASPSRFVRAARRRPAPRRPRGAVVAFSVSRGRLAAAGEAIGPSPEAPGMTRRAGSRGGTPAAPRRRVPGPARPPLGVGPMTAAVDPDPPRTRPSSPPEQVVERPHDGLARRQDPAAGGGGGPRCRRRTSRGTRCTNPGVQDCGSPVGFFLTDRENVTILPGLPSAPENAVALAEQPTCRDRAEVEMRKAAIATAAFFGLGLSGIVIGLLDDRVAYWRAPRYETLLAPDGPRRPHPLRVGAERRRRRAGFGAPAGRAPRGGRPRRRRPRGLGRAGLRRADRGHPCRGRPDRAHAGPRGAAVRRRGLPRRDARSAGRCSVTAPRRPRSSS